MPIADDEHTGQRVARIRKLRHLTQQGLATASHSSASMVAQVEQGKKQPSPALLAAYARALSVPVTDLAGQPYLAELQQDQLDGLINPIRESLDVYDLGADPGIRPRSLDNLVLDADRLCSLVRATDLRTAASELPGLIQEITTSAHLKPSDRAWSALASTYRSAYDVATKLGFYDLASIALDRMAWAAERGSDPAMAGVRQYLRSLGYLRAGQYRTGRRLAEIGHQTVALADPGRARDAVTGQLHLGAAVLAARDRDGDTAMGHIDEARRYAEVTGEALQVHWLTFGPTNVAVHHASILVDQDLYAQALAVAKTIRVPEDWPASRASHHRAEIARAQLWTGRIEAAFRNLLEARRLAPQQTRYSPTVRDTVTGLLTAKRAAPDTLANFAAWVGM
ncbi:helix-turn-helix domain-containing protein [Streptacidiphilus cavernicola]|uniref:Helix-turn-helix domain-containing protein n=1 Tax=Streptacidiphilus cavernicola TaxID=3342716 RepID=A0ABV6W4P9_9ACTN